MFLFLLLHLLADEECNRKAHAENDGNTAVAAACCPQATITSATSHPGIHHWSQAEANCVLGELAANLLHQQVRADNFVLPLITVNLLLSAVCVYMLSFFYFLLHLLISSRSAITKPKQRTETPQFPSLLACSHLHRASLKCVDEFSCPEPLSAPYSHVSLSEVEGDRRRSLLLQGALQGACRGSGSPWQGVRAPADHFKAPDRHHEAGFHCPLHAYIITLPV